MEKLEYGEYSLVVEENFHKASKATLFYKEKLCAESYGPDVLSAVIRVFRGFLQTENSLMLLLLEYGIKKGYEGSELDVTIEQYEEELRDVYETTKL